MVFGPMYTPLVYFLTLRVFCVVIYECLLLFMEFRPAKCIMAFTILETLSRFMFVSMFAMIVFVLRGAQVRSSPVSWFGLVRSGSVWLGLVTSRRVARKGLVKSTFSHM